MDLELYVLAEHIVTLNRNAHRLGFAVPGADKFDFVFAWFELQLDDGSDALLLAVDEDRGIGAGVHGQITRIAGALWLFVPGSEWRVPGRFDDRLAHHVVGLIIARFVGLAPLLVETLPVEAQL